MSTEIVICRRKLPCSVAELEAASLEASSSCHYHDAYAYVDADGSLVVAYDPNKTVRV